MPLGLSFGTYDRIAPGLYAVDLRAGFGDTRLVKGLEKLAVEVFFVLFTTQNSIPGSPIGTRLKGFAGQLNATNNTGIAIAAIGNEFTKAESQIKSSQAKSTIPPDEKLKSIVVDSVTVDRTVGSAGVRMIIVNQLGQSVGFHITGIAVTGVL